jgi:hypothetical protein
MFLSFRFTFPLSPFSPVLIGEPGPRGRHPNRAALPPPSGLPCELNNPSGCEKLSDMMRTKISFTVAAVVFMLLLVGAPSRAQSGATRPRRVIPVQPTPTPAENRVATSTPAGTRTTGTAAATTGGTSPAGQGTTQRAFALLQQKQYDAAIKEAKQIAAADPKNAEAWKIAGFAELELKQYEEAAAALERAATKSTDNPEIFRELGYVYENLKQYAKALSAYERGLQIAPDDADLKESAERIRPFAK